MSKETLSFPELTVPPPGQQTAPKTIECHITGKCNLGCQYCFYNDEMQALKDLSTQGWLDFLQEAGRIGVQDITLTGGEPFTRPDFLQLVDGVIANKMRYCILTNGTLLTKEMVGELLKGKRRTRLNYVQVSIDGSTAEVHNSSRPPNSFHRAIAGLRLLVENGFNVTVRVTINKHNVDDLENIARLLLEDIGLPSFSTNEAEHMGSARCHGQSIELNWEQRFRAMKTLTELNQKYQGRISANAGPLSLAKMVKEIEAQMAQSKEGPSGRGTLCSCGGAFGKMAVLHDGTMVPCNMLPKLVMGVVGIHPLKESWLYHPAINLMRYRRQVPLKSLPECRDCEYIPFCAGGCPAGVVGRGGGILTPDTFLFCYKKYLEEAKKHGIR